MKQTNRSKIGFVLCAVLAGALTGCVGYVDEPRHARGYAQSPPVQEAVIVVQDDYVYYPRYQVYYSNYRHQYIYQDGHSWASRPAPPHVSVDVLFASPSVRLDFHDSPEHHHATVVRQYPKHWSPPGHSSNHGEGKKNNGNGNDKGEHRDD